MSPRKPPTHRPPGRKTKRERDREHDWQRPVRSLTVPSGADDYGGQYQRPKDCGRDPYAKSHAIEHVGTSDVHTRHSIKWEGVPSLVFDDHDAVLRQLRERPFDRPVRRRVDSKLVSIRCGPQGLCGELQRSRLNLDPVMTGAKPDGESKGKNETAGE